MTDKLEVGIGESMISLPSNSNKQQDLQAIELIMLELMEPGTILTKSKSVTLNDPQKWSNEARNFLERTFKSTTVDGLLAVSSHCSCN